MRSGSFFKNSDNGEKVVFSIFLKTRNPYKIGKKMKSILCKQKLNKNKQKQQTISWWKET